MKTAKADSSSGILVLSRPPVEAATTSGMSRRIHRTIARKTGAGRTPPLLRPNGSYARRGQTSGKQLHPSSFSTTMIDLKQLDKLFQRQPGNSLLGLSFDGSRLDGVLVRRTNGSVEIKKTFVASLSLDPLTAEVELVGREIRNQLDAEQIRERWCAVCLPVNWALTLTVKLPEIPEEDIADFLQIEAERGFPYSPQELMIAHSRFPRAAKVRSWSFTGCRAARRCAEAALDPRHFRRRRGGGPDRPTALCCPAKSGGDADFVRQRRRNAAHIGRCLRTDRRGAGTRGGHLARGFGSRSVNSNPRCGVGAAIASWATAGPRRNRGIPGTRDLAWRESRHVRDHGAEEWNQDPSATALWR